MDDLGISLSNGGFIFIQAKAGLSRLDRASQHLGKALDQVVEAYIHGIPTADGFRQLREKSDRLLILTDERGSASFQLSSMFARLRDHPQGYPLDQVAGNHRERRALTILRDSLASRWRRSTGTEIREPEFRAILRSLQITRLDFSDPAGLHLRRCHGLLAPDDDVQSGRKVFGALFKMGVELSARRGWVSTDYLKVHTRKVCTAHGIFDLPARKQPFLERFEADPHMENPRHLIISGGPGSGKTVLGTELAYRWASRFPDGQVLINLGGYGPGRPLTLDEAAGILLERLKAPDNGPDGISRYHRLIESRRLLIVLDNADDAVVEGLLPRRGESVVIITGRSNFGGLLTRADIAFLRLGDLSSTQAEQLLRAYVDDSRITHEGEAFRKILRTCGGLPLAVAMVGGRVREAPGLPLSFFAEQLDDRTAMLDIFELGEFSVSLVEVFSWSVDPLPEDLRDAFLLCGGALGPTLGIDGARALLQRPRAERVLRQLTRRQLLAEGADGFTMHDLLREYALERGSASVGTVSLMNEANLRLLRHYAVRAPELERARSWTAADIARYLAAFEYGLENGLLSEAITIADALIERLWHTGSSQKCLDMLDQLLTALEGAENRPYFERLRAVTLRRLGRHREGAEAVQRVLRHLEPTRELERARCEYVLAVILSTSGNHEQAIAHYRSAVEVFASSGVQGEKADALNGLGWSEASLGRLRDGLEHCMTAAQIHAELKEDTSHAADLDSIACIYRDMGDNALALEYFERSLTLYRSIGHEVNTSRALLSMAEVLIAVGEPARATEARREAAEIARRIDNTS
ncbi:tetratricopeptide repeat protein [Actinocorallia sp. A-T 12471]|uniref:tetratricopeptide repeat protein n=1 Tax=Actinocorallia sp. A-T 12471 TaxID=3089813 RepID=UPI0029CC61B7|nr:tetratricopeptide repeat protein [Actinocorallia sp. A-T 12471]MDX6738458.1 tetratricopeptide repeat protein [Actinocorallia sp. A-T 12471]